MKKKLLYVISILIMIAFVLMPSRMSNLYIRIYFDKFDIMGSKIEGDYCTLYYSTDTINVFSPAQYVRSNINYDSYQVEFCLDSSLAKHITGLRLDFPNKEQLLSIKNITVSSGGVIKRQYNPCDFFANENIAYANNIYAMDLATASAHAYIGTMENESYVILSNELCQQIINCYSNLRLTKLAICAFILGCYFFAKKKIFINDTL